ncbi:hypothetical protein NZD89_22410 [Alicyclobacillus fastidiosus]|uniref:Uncharacterized protein n=1 Tax=Alicyclobacillus fastidiosus TaxID=392011 RepID=A0ABY6ZDT3_9BACL|nr:hypothetical protein [Alicyclobacillus fastidiosus]WAH41011.1 hypothetical protein NZD89_22410 [Alicyclobacillus fastidiosus]GMA62527.1 hypothetical protein GCM10025859_29670 [Alicyclobacillus fastidiosus]
MTAVPFAIVGGGFRTGYFLRVARALPNRFRVSGRPSFYDLRQASQDHYLAILII